MQADDRKFARLRLTLILLCLIVLGPIVLGFAFPWSELNCRHEEVDIRSGRIRTTQYFWFLPIYRGTSETSLSSNLRPEDLASSVEEWHRVNTFSPGLHYSPHYRYHGTIFLIRELDTIWDLGQFDSAARRSSARRILELWQIDGDDFRASRYLQTLSEVAFVNSERHVPTTVEQLELLSTAQPAGR